MINQEFIIFGFLVDHLYFGFYFLLVLKLEGVYGLLMMELMLYYYNLDPQNLRIMADASCLILMLIDCL